MDDYYMLYIRNFNSEYRRLARLPKLSIKDIKIYKEPYKMAFLFYYGYSSMYKKYEFEDLNRRIHKWSYYDLYKLLIICGNIKAIKYLVSKGVNINTCNNKGHNNYYMAISCDNIKLIKYFESIGVNIHKKSDIGINAYLLATYQGNIKLMKHLEKKGVNIYSRNIYGNNYFYSFGCNYDKIAPYVFKNMNYKLNRYKMCFI